MSNINKLLDVMAKLRNPQSGCPWDVAQDFHTISPYTVEEAYEVADAIAREDMADLRDELGDLLFQVVFHSRMAEEAGAFQFSEVVDSITAKMVRRHPLDQAGRRQLERLACLFQRLPLDARLLGLVKQT